MAEMITEEVCPACRRVQPHIDGILLFHLKPTGHHCNGCSAEEARHLSAEMSRASAPVETVEQMQVDPCNWCDRTQQQVYPKGPAIWFAKGASRICGQCIIIMCDSVIGSNQETLNLEKSNGGG